MACDFQGQVTKGAVGISLVVQRLKLCGPDAEGLRLIPAQGT